MDRTPLVLEARDQVSALHTGTSPAPAEPTGSVTAGVGAPSGPSVTAWSVHICPGGGKCEKGAPGEGGQPSNATGPQPAPLPGWAPQGRGLPASSQSWSHRELSGGLLVTGDRPPHSCVEALTTRVVAFGGASLGVNYVWMRS